MLAVDHRFALSKPALLSALSKKLSRRCSPPVGLNHSRASTRQSWRIDLWRAC
jgi:hypothetical protein